MKLKNKIHHHHDEDLPSLFPGLFGKAHSGQPGSTAILASVPSDATDQRRIAASLLAELNEYEKLQSKGRTLPALRFHVRIVRSSGGTQERSHIVLNATQLREKLTGIVGATQESDNLFADFISGRPKPVPKPTVKDKSIYPSFEYDGHALPEGSQACPICLCEYEEGEMMKLVPCMHFYHEECIDEWMGRSNECPVCKTKME